LNISKTVNVDVRPYLFTEEDLDTSGLVSWGFLAIRSGYFWSGQLGFFGYPMCCRKLSLSNYYTCSFSWKHFLVPSSHIQSAFCRHLGQPRSR